MKHLFFVMTFLASILTTAASATDNNSNKVSRAVEVSFNAQFKGATDVTWRQTADLEKAEFVLNGHYVSAFYDNEARLVAVTRNISSLQLPLMLQNSVRKSYADHWVSDLFELSNDEGTHYYITLERAGSTITLQSDSNKWTVFRKATKC